jgi:TatD DNase family protein
MNSIIDTHCHYNLEPLWDPTQENAWKTHWSAAQERGVITSIIIGTEFDSSSHAVSMASSQPNLWASVGIHPNHVTDASLTELPDVWQLGLIINPKVVAVGETGLDYFRMDTDPQIAEQTRTLQQQALLAHLQFAMQHDLPVILHVRDQKLPDEITSGNAYWDTYQLVKDHYQGTQPVILHCVSGPVSYLKKMLELGAYVGVAANVTYPSAEPIRQLVAATPVDRLLLETDAPFLPPQGYRGQTCEPWMIAHTSEYLQETFAISPQQLIENTYRLFPKLTPAAQLEPSV